MLRRIATELRDLRDLVLVPLLSALLPQRAGWLLLRFAARFEGLYGEASSAALNGRLMFSQVADQAAWRQQLRLVLLADASDFFIARLGGWRRIQRRITTVQGRWPEQGPFCALGLHWGAGLWTLHHLRAQAQPSAMVLAPLDPNIASYRTIASKYWRARGREIERAGGDKVLFTGSGSETIGEQLSRGGNVLCLGDVPGNGSGRCSQIRVLGQPVQIRTGVFDLLASNQIPVVRYRMQLDLKTGLRSLVIADAMITTQADELIQGTTDWLNQSIHQHDASWHLWRGFGRQLAQRKSQRNSQR